MSPSEKRRLRRHPLYGMVSGSTRQGRRIRKAYERYLAALTDANPSPLVLTNIASAAQLKIAVEDLQSRQVTGEDVSESLVRMANLLHRTERKAGLGIGNAQREQKRGPSLAEVVAEIKAKGAASRVTR
jgi:hypothetical protein